MQKHCEGASRMFQEAKRPPQCTEKDMARVGMPVKSFAPRRSQKQTRRWKPKAKASRSTYLDIGLIHIGRLLRYGG